MQLTPDQKAFVRQAIESGRLHREEEAVKEALALWEERERTRAEILSAVDLAEASLSRSEGRVITEESMQELARQVTGLRSFPVGEYVVIDRVEGDDVVILRVLRGSRNLQALF